MGKKIGYFFLSLTPAITCLVLQITMGLVIGMVYAVADVLKANATSPEVVQQIVVDAIARSSATGVFGYHIIGIIVFGLWYYFGCKRPKPTPPKSIASVKFWGSAVLAGIVFISMNYIVIFLLNIFFPSIIENYIEVWSQMEVGNETLLTIATVCLAPIGEELLMRGLIFYYARKCTSRFWIANGIQAFLFGFIHFNLVQGTYAFIGGLLLGWLYKKYNSLYIVILVHFIVNLSACTWADPVFSRIPDDFRWWACVMAVIFGLLAILIIWNKEKEQKETTQPELTVS